MLSIFVKVANDIRDCFVLRLWGVLSVEDPLELILEYVDQICENLSFLLIRNHPYYYKGQ